MVSKYNPLFNGEQALLRGQTSLATIHEEDFNQILPVFRFGTKEQASNVKPDMDKAIEKAARVINEHSMMIKNKQRNSYVDDSYLLIGKARFYKREYLEALETFNYVVQTFPKSDVREEARLWAAQTETELGNYLAAKTKLEEIYRSDDLPKKLKPLAFAAYAQLEINQKRYMPAYQLLSQAVKRTRVKDNEVRWTFIMGQLQAKIGNENEASELFRKVIKMGPPYELLFQAQLNRARHYDVDINDPEIVFDDLRKMLKDDKNYDNKDQIYYVMAEISERMGDDANVELYLKESIRVSTVNQDQKALSYLKLGELNFDYRLYPLAAAYYDSAFTSLKSTHPRYKEIEKKNASLSKLVENLNIIAYEDSVQVLAALTETERNKRIDQFILQKKAAEEAAKRAEEENPFNSFQNDEGSIAQNNQNSIQGGAWYFYNQRLRAAGITEFSMKFGNRKLEDNWRRENKEVIELFETENEESEKEMDAFAEGDTGLTENQERQEYLKNIPLTEAALANSDMKILNAYMMVASIYKNDFEDMNAAETELRALLKRYPDMDDADKGKTWYMLYRVNVLANDSKDAEYFKNLILQELPDSEYADLLMGKQLAAIDMSMSESYYKLTYAKYEDKNYKKTVSMADSALGVFSKAPEGPKYMMLKAFSEGKLGKKEKMTQTLKEVVGNYSGTTQATEAQRILDRLTEPEEAATTKELAKPTTQKETSKYTIKATEEHKYVLALPNVSGLVYNVNVELTDFNKKFFKNIPLNAKTVYISAQQQMILISGFPNEKEALRYFEILGEQKTLSASLSGQTYQHFVISNSNFTIFYQDKNFNEYEKFFQDNYLNK